MSAALVVVIDPIFLPRSQSFITSIKISATASPVLGVWNLENSSTACLNDQFSLAYCAVTTTDLRYIKGDHASAVRLALPHFLCINDLSPALLSHARSEMWR